MLHNWMDNARKAFTSRFSLTAIPNYGGLFDISSYALLCMHQNAAAVNFMTKCFPDTIFLNTINYPNYKQSFFLLNVPTEQYPEWSYTPSTKTFSRMRSDLVTDSLRQTSRLAVAKCEAANLIINGVNSARLRRGTGVVHQEFVYVIKRMQAKSFRDSGYDENLILEYPYVLQYADLAGITPREAADEILLKAKIQDTDLAKSELLRMKYMQNLKDIKTPEEIAALTEEFSLEFHRNAKV